MEFITENHNCSKCRTRDHVVPSPNCPIHSQASAFRLQQQSRRVGRDLKVRGRGSLLRNCREATLKKSCQLPKWDLNQDNTYRHAYVEKRSLMGVTTIDKELQATSQWKVSAVSSSHYSWRKNTLFFTDLRVGLSRIPFLGLVILGWVQQYSQTLFAQLLFCTKGNFLSHSAGWFLKSNGICRVVIISIRRGCILLLYPFFPLSPSSLFKREVFRQSLEWVPQPKTP